MTYSLSPPRWIGAVLLNLCVLSTVFLKYLRDLDLDSFCLRCISISPLVYLIIACRCQVVLISFQEI